MRCFWRGCLCLTIASAGAAAVLASPDVLSGLVVNGAGEPIPRAEITILGHSGSAAADAEGRFVWSPRPRAPFEILVILPGGRYMAPVLVESLPEAGPIVVTVEPLVTESVTVASGATPNISAPPASGTTLVPRENIAERHPPRLTDVIQSIPGAGHLSDLHAAVPSLRGLARGRTLLLLDGARVTTERRAGPSATYLDPFFLEAVEVSRGPGSVAYGSDAFGGVIHARTRRVEPGAPTKLRMRGALGAGLPEASGGLELTHGFDRGGIVLQGRYRSFESYRSPEGEVFNSQASDRGFLARVGHEIPGGSFEVGWQTDQGRDTGRPDTRGESAVTSYPREDSHRLTASYELDPRGGFTRLGLSGFWGAYGLLTERQTPAIDDDPSTLSRADVSARDFGVRAIAVRPIGRARWELGADVNGRYGLEAADSFVELGAEGATLFRDETSSIENARRIDAALYSSAEMLLGSHLTASGGARVDRVTTKNEGGSLDDAATENAALSGYGSLKLELARGLSVTGQISRGFRDPTLSDRYFRGISGRGFVTGNPELRPESATQFDAALRFVRRGFRWAVYGYAYRISDLVERFEREEDIFFFRNRGEAELRGLEVEMQASFGEYLLELGAQVARGDTLDDDSPLDDVPVESLKLELRRSFGAAYGQIRASVFAADGRPGPTEIDVPRYGVVDLGGGLPLSEHLELRVLVRNVFNETYPVSPDRRAVLAPGRNAVVTVVAEF